MRKAVLIMACLSDCGFQPNGSDRAIESVGRLGCFTPNATFVSAAVANKVAVPGLNSAVQNLPYIQVLTAQRERQKLGRNCRPPSWLGTNGYGRTGHSWHHYTPLFKFGVGAL